MGIKDTLRRRHMEVKTFVHLHRARRRTRQVFRRKPNMFVVVATILIVIMCLIVYFVVVYPTSERNLGVIDENTFDNEDSVLPGLVEDDAEVLMDVEQEPAPEDPAVIPARSWPINITIPNNITLANLHGDTSQDTLLPGDCTQPIKDAKRDLEREFRYNQEAQDNLDNLEEEYLQAQKNVQAAYADFAAKRQKLDAIRISCIEEKKPFEEPFNEFLDVAINSHKE